MRQSAFLTVLALLPVALLAGSSIVLASRQVTAPVNRRTDRLLLVDDNPINQKVCRAVLGRLGYDVDVAADGLQALQQVSAKRYAAILMDCQMPNMDGYQATQTLRRREGPDRHTPVIVMTASAMTTDRDRCLQAGMDDYLTKPLHMAALGATLRYWLDGPGKSSGHRTESNASQSAAPGPVEEMDRT